MASLIIGHPEQYDPVYRRGQEFYDEIELKTYNADGSPSAVDLNGATITAEIRASQDLDGALIASLTVVPLDLSDGWFGFYQTNDETEAFDRSTNVGAFFLYISGDVTNNVRVVLLQGTVSVKNASEV